MYWSKIKLFEANITLYFLIFKIELLKKLLMKKIDECFYDENMEKNFDF